MSEGEASEGMEVATYRMVEAGIAALIVWYY